MNISGIIFTEITESFSGYTSAGRIEKKNPGEIPKEISAGIWGEILGETPGASPGEGILRTVSTGIFEVKVSF